MPPERPLSEKLAFVVVDDHDSVLEGTCSVLQNKYPSAMLQTAGTAAQALTLVQQGKPPDLIVMDLSIPQKSGEDSQTDVGLALLRSLMEAQPELNIVVQSANVRTLVRLKPMIDNHLGGFTIADKSLPKHEMLTKVEWSLKGVVYTPREMRTGLEVKPEWLQMLQLACQEGLTDRAIAEKMNIAERTVRHYWTKVQDALDVYPDESKNTRIQTLLQARKFGLID
jgi:DNA-binding NarL/FixJ family response regulator